MEFFTRYSKYFSGTTNVPPPQPFSDNKCSVCLEHTQDTNEKFTVPCCKKIFHGKCLGEWLIKHDSCPMCRQELVNNDQRMRSSAITYLPITKEMTWYRYCLWMIGANRKVEFNINKLLDSINDRNLKSSNYEYLDYFRYLMFGQHLLTNERKIICSKFFHNFTKVINLIPFIVVSISNLSSNISRWWTILITLLYALRYNMLFMSSHDIRSLMYNNFPNSTIGWIYYTVLFSFKYFIVFLSAIYSNDRDIKNISTSLITIDIGISVFYLFLNLSIIHGLINKYVTIYSDILNSELFENTNAETFFQRYSSTSTSDVVSIIPSIINTSNINTLMSGLTNLTQPYNNLVYTHNNLVNYGSEELDSFIETSTREDVNSSSNFSLSQPVQIQNLDTIESERNCDELIENNVANFSRRISPSQSLNRINSLVMEMRSDPLYNEINGILDRTLKSTDLNNESIDVNFKSDTSNSGSIDSSEFKEYTEEDTDQKSRISENSSKTEDFTRIITPSTPIDEKKIEKERRGWSW